MQHTLCDCGRITDDSVEFTEFIRRKTGLYISDGAEYGDAGRKFVRINLACQKKRLEDGMNRLKNAVNAYETEV